MKIRRSTLPAIALGCAAAAPLLFAGEPDPFQGLEAKPARAPAEDGGFFRENFAFKKEVFSRFSYDLEKDVASSRQSLGFEMLKKFSSPTATFASVDFQGRLARRDGFVETPDDPMGESRRGWAFEVHNLYADAYNLGDTPGRFNFRLGHFYLPLGLNLQTDTHGTLLQLSNDRNLGFDRDWYAGFWGSAGPDLRYDAYWLLGSGDDLSFRGQTGMIGTRLSLSGRHRNEEGLEGGLAVLGGQRISAEATERSPSVAAVAGRDHAVGTLRAGPDVRYTFLVPTGSLALAAELSAGHDGPDAVLTQLYQADYLTTGRRWGLSGQYRRFWQEIGAGRPLPPGFMSRDADASVFLELTRYFRNDVANTTLDWVALAVERRLERQEGPTGTIVSLQYYHYW